MALIDRAKNIIISPKTEWPVIASEEPNGGSMVSGYALPLILVSAAAAFVGYGLIGYSVLGIKVCGINWGIHHALMAILMGILSIYITSFVVDALAPSFGSEKNNGRAMQLVVYSMTPAWVGGILQVLPSISWIGSLFGLYSIYLIYLGLPHTMKTPQEKVVMYMIVTLVVLILVYIVLGLILGSIFMGIFGLSTPTPTFNIQ